MLISYYANKKSSPRLPSWQPSLISFNTPIDSESIIKPCTLKHFQVPILAPGLWCQWHPGITVNNSEWSIQEQDSYRCRYNAVNCLANPLNESPISLTFSQIHFFGADTLHNFVCLIQPYFLKASWFEMAPDRPSVAPFTNMDNFNPSMDK